MQKPTLEEMYTGFKQAYTAAISEILDADFELYEQWLGPEIKPLLPHMQVAGPAFTLRWVNDRNVWPDKLREKLVLMLDSLQPLVVPVIDTSKNTNAGYWGEIVCNLSQAHGVEGAVIDGAVRDSPYVVKLGFNMFARFTCANTAHRRSSLESFQEPITINNVLIRPGDFIVGDLDGVVVVPQEIVIDVYHKAQELLKKESSIRNKIKAGASAAEYILSKSHR